MKAVLIAPRKYVQGRGVLAEAGTYVRLLGKKPLVLWDACVRELVGAMLLTSLKESGLEAVEVLFEGESSKAEAAANHGDRPPGRGRRRRRRRRGQDARHGQGGRRGNGRDNGHLPHDRLERFAHQRRHRLVRRRRQLLRLGLLAVQSGHRLGGQPGDRQRAGSGLRGGHGRRPVHLARSRGLLQEPRRDAGRRGADDGGHGRRAAVLRHAHGARHRGQAGAGAAMP